MTRAEALKRLDNALGEGIERMFTILEASFASTKIENAEAEKHFEFGISCQLEAHAYASRVINNKFKE
jgi:hypothetical protein